ncbi:uncharacterized protein RAG0_14502 [Rhynchosporium agropyri]|uniref:Uncharacterized protein n=1 Tax=Rhynchosporium agropyri TaxID=914238 RepID=A0A1E1LHA8_9HELO|nr:uncharacterized protein RAG0_14502 [Rhynchosporium agropyri]
MRVTWSSILFWLSSSRHVPDIHTCGCKIHMRGHYLMFLYQVGILFPTCNSNPSKLQRGQVAYTYITNANIPEWFGFTEASSASHVLSPVQPQLPLCDLSASYSSFVLPADQEYPESNFQIARAASFLIFPHCAVHPRSQERAKNEARRSFSSQSILQQTPSSACRSLSTVSEYDTSFGTFKLTPHRCQIQFRSHTITPYHF